MKIFKEFLHELENEYPIKDTIENNNVNYGRTMMITLKSGVIHSVLSFRWEHQNSEDISNEIFCFNTGNREIDKLKIKFEEIERVYYN